MKFKNKKILITGGAGFIGSHLAEEMVNLGADVLVIDNLFSSNINNLSNIMEKINFYKIDIRNYDLIKDFKDIDIIFHLAANANVPYSVENPEYDFQTNVIGTYNILKLCLEIHVDKIIFASSAAVYGESEYTPIDEKHPLNPISPYGASKLSGEALGMTYFKTFGVPFISMRIFNTYGERQQRYVMFDLINKLKSGEKILEVLGTGKQIRDFCYVKDTIKAFLLVLEKKNTIGNRYNIGFGNPISIKDLTYKLVELMDLKNKVEIHFTGTSWPGDIINLYPDISKIKRLGFRPTVELDQGLKRLINWIGKSSV
ncbi:MAG: SDR family NAD(P)-dependent oxidoreductase [Candidatus Helarchaeota archaeon]